MGKFAVICGVTWSVYTALAITSLPAHADTNVCSTGPFVEGVDVYSGDGTIDWAAAAKDGIQFAFMKATQGNYYEDDQFKANWENTKANGVVRGAYHFFDPTVDGVVQANYFLAEMGPLSPGDLAPMLDIECPDGDADCLGGASGDAPAATITKAMTDFLTTVEAATGKKSIIYTFGSYFSSNSVPTTGLANYPLYIAYPTTTNCFSVPTPWTSAPFWQYSWTGTITGIDNAAGVDRDHFLGTLADLVAFSNGGFSAPSQVTGNHALSVASFADGHLDVFAKTVAGNVSHSTTTTSGDTWSKPASLGQGTCGAASVMWAPGNGHTVELFDGLGDGSTQSLEATSNTVYSAFTTFGGAGLSQLSTVAYGDGHIEVFALGSDNALWHNVSAKSSWGGWETMGGSFVTGAGTILWTDGHAEIFTTDANGVAWHNYTNTASPPVWQGFSQLKGPPLASRPIPARWADGHVEVFARGADNHLYLSNYTNDTWPAFTVLDKTQVIAGEPSVLVYPNYGPEVFVRDGAGNLIHAWNTNNTWSAWANDFSQVLASDPLAYLRPDGNAEVFGIDASGNLIKALHDVTTGDWSSWSTLGTGFDACISTDSGGNVGGADGGEEFGDPDASVVSIGDAPTSSSGCACGTTPATSGSGAALGAMLGVAVLGLRRSSHRQKRHAKKSARGWF